jgi:hypothetical protein
MEAGGVAVNQPAACTIYASLLDVLVISGDDLGCAAYRPWLITACDSSTGIIAAHIVSSDRDSSAFENLPNRLMEEKK